MRKYLLIMGMFSLIFTSGCSKEPAKDDQSQTNVEQTEPVDTLAAKTYPIRNDDNPIITIETDFGVMIAELYRDVAPAHADSFVARASEGFYDGLEIFRVVKNFMIQTGDPKNNGMGNAGYFLTAEFSDLPHQDGTLSMARSRSPNSASSQFFICLSRNRQTAYLDNKYTAFGQLLKGYDVLHKIGDVVCEANPNNPSEISHPVEPVKMIKVYLSEYDGE